MFNQAIQKLATLLGMDVHLSTISEEDLILFILESEGVWHCLWHNVDTKVINIDSPPKESIVWLFNLLKDTFKDTFL